MTILLRVKLRKKVSDGPSNEKLVTKRWRASWFDVARSSPLRKGSYGTFATFISVPEDPFRRGLERATSNQDARHRFVTNFSLSGPSDTFLHNFTLSNIVILQSPRPFTLFVGFDSNNDTIPAADRVGNLSRN